MLLYCERADLFAFGLTRGALPSVARLAGTVDTADDTIDLDNHGFASGTPVEFRAEGRDSVLPSPLAVRTTYYAIPVTASRFRVSAAPDGDAIGLMSAGAKFRVLSPLPEEEARTAATAIIDDMLPAHLTPLAAPVPEIIRVTAAELAACRLGLLGGKDMAAVLDAAQKRLAAWAKGKPVRGDGAPARVPVGLSLHGLAHDSTGWSRFGGTGG